MANPVTLSDYGAQQEELQNRLKYAQLLQQQGGDIAKGNMVGNTFVAPSWTQHAANLAKQLTGAYEEKQATQGLKSLAGRMEGERSTDLTALANALRGTPQTPQQFDPQEAQQSADQGTPMPYNPAVPGDPNQAAALALQSKFGDIRSMAPGFMNIAETRQNRADDRTFRAEQAEAARKAREAELAQRAADARASAQERAEAQRQLTQMQIDARRDLASFAAANRPAPQVQVVQTENGVFQVLPDGTTKPMIDPATGKTLMPKTQQKGKTDVEKTMSTYMAASEGLINGLSGASTGPIAGRIPAVTTNAQIAEGGVAAMAPVLKQIFRVAGEGTFTDKDQELLMKMVPTRTDSPEAAKVKIENIDRIVAEKMGLDVPMREWSGKAKPITTDRRATPRDSAKRVVVDY